MTSDAAASAAAMRRLHDAVRVVRAETAVIPRAAVVLDRALAGLAGLAAVQASLPLGGGLELLVGALDGVPIALAVAGADLPVAVRADAVRIARLLGAETLVTALSARRLAPDPADLGVVDDHVGFLVPNPLVGPNLADLGPRFPDLTAAYDPALRAIAWEEAARSGPAPARGVYAALPEPNLASAGEYSFLVEAGVDWVGRGGAPEAIAARHAGMRVLGLLGSEGSEIRLAALVRRVLARLA